MSAKEMLDQWFDSLINVIVEKVLEHIKQEQQANPPAASEPSTTFNEQLQALRDKMERIESDVDDHESRLVEAEEVTQDIDSTVREAVRNLDFEVRVS